MLLVIKYQWRDLLKRYLDIAKYAYDVFSSVKYNKGKYILLNIFNIEKTMPTIFISSFICTYIIVCNLVCNKDKSTSAHFMECTIPVKYFRTPPSSTRRSPAVSDQHSPRWREY